MEVLKTLFTGTLIALLFIVANASAQVSNVEGIEPMDGVAIPKAQTSQPQAAKPGTIFKDCGECPEMVVIPAGSFLMGSPTDPEPDPFSNRQPEKMGNDYERPQHKVNINSFAIGKYEVTQEQWYTVMGDNPSPDKGRMKPVSNVSWDDAQLFVQKLSLKTGKKYRLPSEAEWEYVARSDGTSIFPWGSNYDQFHDFAVTGQLMPVGSKKPNKFGIYDMAGNVYEWTQDCLNKNYKNAPNDGSSWTSGWLSMNCESRMLRGGSWDSHYDKFRSANRSWYTKHSKRPSDQSGVFGLRIARDN